MKWFWKYQQSIVIIIMLIKRKEMRSCLVVRYALDVMGVTQQLAGQQLSQQRRSIWSILFREKTVESALFLTFVRDGCIHRDDESKWFCMVS